MHEMTNSVPSIPMFFPTSSLDSIDLNHLQIRDLKRLHGLTVLSVQHEVWTNICNGTFGNRIMEALNPNIPTVMLYPSGFPGKSWDPTPGLHLRLNCWLCPQLLSLLDNHLISHLRFLEGGEGWPFLLRHCCGNSLEDSS